ncbi:MAG: DUF1109 domain-containing protein [Comamonadaceae bacterium]|nr:MAG: DUF1109 domain-containing protein [Comamonadaceae bacterium]
MKTDELIAMLARGVQPVPRHAAARRLGLALAAGVPLSILWMLIEYGARRDLLQTMALPMFWVKLAFPLCIAVSGFVLSQRLARPGVKARAAWTGVLLPVLLLWVLGLFVWWEAPFAERGALVFGRTWRSCAFSIVAISLPVFVAALAAMRGLAPVRPASAGAAAGAMAAGVGAAIYALHCPELAAPFLGIWYVAGMAATAALGAVLGRIVLRW